ncbi:hypothetical protein [Vibrio parahaemolyticus]|nr:hypothetical protein [Vibrio parahaemolyticus]ELB2163018.1 hypothetical protein [Vibrio parahaemolyticus]
MRSVRFYFTVYGFSLAGYFFGVVSFALKVFGQIWGISGAVVGVRS